MPNLRDILRRGVPDREGSYREAVIRLENGRFTVRVEPRFAEHHLDSSFDTHAKARAFAQQIEDAYGAWVRDETQPADRRGARNV